MNITIITCAYDPQLGECDTTKLDQFCQEYNVLDYQGHLTIHEGLPLWTVLISYRNHKPKYLPPQKNQSRNKVEPFRQLSVEQRPLYNAIRQWRKQQSEQEGKPAFALLKNEQIADIVRKLPTSIKALKTIDGIGDATATKYGTSLFAIITQHQSQSRK